MVPRVAGLEGAHCIVNSIVPVGRHGQNESVCLFACRGIQFHVGEYCVELQEISHLLHASGTSSHLHCIQSCVCY